jgi:beta-xylosidase
MWSIAIYSGPTPFQLQPAPPVLTKSDITDIPADFVADPFMLRRNDTWYMFFEVMRTDTELGEIGLATSNDAHTWTYDRIVLREPFHLSYPHVFEWQNDYYMLPETLNAGAVCLYKALDFPYNWSVVARLIEGQLADPSILRFNDLWWLFACSTPYQHDTLRLCFANELTGPWTEHPKSPLIRNDKCRARPAGRILNFNNRLFRFAQDCGPRYGSSVRAFEITKLTKDNYAETELHIPILKASGNGWNAKGMHHIDAHQQPDGHWLACVDGTQ